MTNALVERARHGDHQAFEQLTSPVDHRLYALARRILRDDYGAEDAVQEALLRAWRDLHTRSADRPHPTAVRTLARMADAVLLVCGLAAAVLGTWRGYVVAREAVGPFVHEGDPTRSLIEAGRPIHARPRVRLFVRRVLVACGWLALAMYGLYLCAAAGS